MDPLTIAAIGMGVFQAGSGFIQNSRSAAMAGRNVRATRETQSGITDNLAAAELRASQGLTSGAKNAYVSNAERGLTTSIDALLRSGSGVNAVGDLYDEFNQGITRLSLAEDSARVNNFNTYMKANMVNAEEDDLNWQVNEYAPWADKAQQATKLKEQGMKNISGGINTAFGAWGASLRGNTNPTVGGNEVSGSGNDERWFSGPDSGFDIRGMSKEAQESYFKSRYGTQMISPNPMNIDYSNKSLATLNGLGLMPLTPGTALNSSWPR